MEVLRRDFLLGSAAVALSGALPPPERLSPLSIRVASNQGVENSALQQLMNDRGFAHRMALDIVIVESKDISGPSAALETGTADLCMISAYAGVLPAIEAGQPLKLIGSAMRLPALAVCSADPRLRSVADLAGRRIGIGERQGLLHLVMLALLRRHGMQEADVQFVTIGSNAQVFRAIVDGSVDAGPCGVASLADAHAHVLRGGELWRELPDFTYQLAYASDDALRMRADAIARCLAAYTLLFRFLSQPDSQEAYLAARKKVGGDREEGGHFWTFVQRAKPYARDAGLSEAHVAYLQRLNVRAGLQHRVLPFRQIADLVPAMAARALLGR